MRLDGGDDEELTYQRGAGLIERYGERAGRVASGPAMTITASGSGGGAGMKYRRHLRAGRSP